MTRHDNPSRLPGETAFDGSPMAAGSNGEAPVARSAFIFSHPMETNARPYLNKASLITVVCAKGKTIRYANQVEAKPARCQQAYKSTGGHPGCAI
ncbi:hypothetical protein [Loktanella sp. 3ANDIMAR09]|uniref:hypothetical protein n=1 Tax=Loktanella sp. 3ANDIMAR09 TaxID=1225657 RepID=UPI001C0FE2A6|nr:hypothetical protein [Loktanella sp. 3ANDIMAR09]